MLRRIVTCLGVLSVVLFCSTIASASYVSVTDLGLGGFNTTAAHNFNSSGDVVVQTGTTINALVWSGGSYTNLGNLGTDYAYPRDINDAGMIVGASKNSSGVERAFKWTSGGGMVDLGSIYTTASTSRAIGVNAAGDIVGDAQATSSYKHSYVIYADDPTTMVDIGYGDYTSAAYKINDNGQIAGMYWTTSNKKSGHAARYSDGAWTDLGVLTGDDTSTAYGLNNRGDVVGTSHLNGTDPYRAFLWTETDGLVNLGILDGGQDYSTAECINELGWIGGAAKDSAGDYHAVVWDADHSILDLNSLIDPNSGWVLQWVKQIDDSGTVAGWGLKDGVQHAFTMTVPVPEPSTLALLAAGLVGLLAYAWRKRK